MLIRLHIARGCLCAAWWSWVFMTEVVWLAKPKIFMLCSFKEEVSWPLIQRFLSNSVFSLTSKLNSLWCILAFVAQNVLLRDVNSHVDIHYFFTYEKDHLCFWWAITIFLAAQIILDWRFSSIVFCLPYLTTHCQASILLLVFEGNLFPCITLPPLPGCFWDFSVFCFYQIYYTVLIFFVFVMPWVYRASWICGWGLLLVLGNSQAYAIFSFALLAFPVQDFYYIYFRSYNLCNTMPLCSFLFLIFHPFVILCLTGVFFSDLSSNSLFFCVCLICCQVLLEFSNCCILLLFAWLL